MSGFQFAHVGRVLEIISVASQNHRPYHGSQIWQDHGVAGKVLHRTSVVEDCSLLGRRSLLGIRFPPLRRWGTAMHVELRPLAFAHAVLFPFFRRKARVTVINCAIINVRVPAHVVHMFPINQSPVFWIPIKLAVCQNHCTSGRDLSPGVLAGVAIMICLC